MILSLDPERHVTGFAYNDGTRIGIINTMFEVPDVDKNSELFQQLKNNYPFYRYFAETNTYSLDEHKYASADWNISADEIRARREVECFQYINRGSLWETMYVTDVGRLTQLREWYVAWLNAPLSHIIPDKPNWIT